MLGILGTLAPRAQAQTSGASAQAAARELFREGVRHLRNRDWEAARDAFQRSYDLSPRPNTLLNLAGTQARTDQLVEAVENYRVFLSSEPSGRTREAAENAIAALEPRLGFMEIIVDGDNSGATLVLDGQEINWAAAEVALPVNPGSHELVVEGREGAIRGRASFSVSEGERRRVPLTVAPPLIPEEPDLIGGGTGGAQEEEPVWEKGWFWGVLGGTVAVIVIAITLGVVLSDRGNSGYEGDFGPPWEFP